MMKRGIYAFLAVLSVLAMIMTGCPKPESGSTTTKITLSDTEITVEIREYKRITATTDPANTRLEWTSSDTTVATVVAASGGVTGVAEGEATITATAPDGGKATCKVTVIKAITSDEVIKIVGETLEHYKAELKGANHFSGNGDKGTTNDDGSYTFFGPDGSDGAWASGGAQYTFPIPKANDTWSLADYNIVEVFFKVTDGTVQAKSAKYGNTTDLKPYPDASNAITFNNTTASLKFVIEEAGSGIGFQRNTGGPATVAIEKAVFSKANIRTITFSGGDNTTMPVPDPIKIPDGRTVNFGNTNYLMPLRPLWTNHHFTGWKIQETEDIFDTSVKIEKDYVLVAQWEDGPPPPVDKKLDLDPASWGTLPSVPSDWLVGSITWPTDYATREYTDGKLKLTFDGRNRQRAIIPLNEEQIDELMNTTEGGVTFKIVGTVERGEQGTLTNDQIPAGDLGFAGFRLHLCNPSVTSNWNGTDTGLQTPLTGNADASNDHLVEYAAFSSNKSKATVGYFVIQAMFRDKNGSDGSTATGFPQVIITIESLTVDIGRTE
jgi:hypothetical protein